MYVDQKNHKNNVLRLEIILKVIINEKLPTFIQQFFYNKFLRFSHMREKKEDRISHLFSKKPQKNLHLILKF